MEFISLLAQTDQIMEQVVLFFETLRPDGIGDILVYLVFFLCLLTTFLLADGNDLASNLLYLTMVLAIFSITVGDQWYTRSDVIYAFPAYIARVGLFLLPWIAAGASRVKKNKGKLALPMGIVTGVIGLLYVVGAFLGIF